MVHGMDGNRGVWGVVDPQFILHSLPQGYVEHRLSLAHVSAGDGLVPGAPHVGAHLWREDGLPVALCSLCASQLPCGELTQSASEARRTQTVTV